MKEAKTQPNPHVWTEEEIYLLQSKWENHSLKEISAMITRFSPSAIKAKAHRLGLCKNIDAKLDRESGLKRQREAEARRERKRKSHNAYNNLPDECKHSQNGGGYKPMAVEVYKDGNFEHWFPSISAAAKWLEVEQSYLTKALKKGYTAKGYEVRVGETLDDTLQRIKNQTYQIQNGNNREKAGRAEDGRAIRQGV